MDTKNKNNSMGPGKRNKSVDDQIKKRRNKHARSKIVISTTDRAKSP
ncbi:MAG: hypothetical protein ACRD5J_19920 [Nitrososphaeraceae archaeon]